MNISIYDGCEDCYWWILCTEKYFVTNRIPEEEKVARIVPVLRGRALQWWFQWSQRYSLTSWDAFTTAILWYFKPEFRDVMPESDEAGKPYSEILNYDFTKSDLESMEPIYETCFHQDFIMEPVHRELPEITLNPLPNLKQEQIQSPCFRASSPFSKLTHSTCSPDSLFKQTCFNGDVKSVKEGLEASSNLYKTQLEQPNLMTEEDEETESRGEKSPPEPPPESIFDQPPIPPPPLNSFCYEENMTKNIDLLADDIVNNIPNIIEEETEEPPDLYRAQLEPPNLYRGHPPLFVEESGSKLTPYTFIATTNFTDFQQKPKISYPEQEFVQKPPPPLKPPDITLSQSPQTRNVAEEATSHVLNTCLSSIHLQHTREQPFTKFPNHFSISENPKHKPLKICANVNYEPRNTTSDDKIRKILRNRDHDSKIVFNIDIDSFTIRSISTLKSEPDWMLNFRLDAFEKFSKTKEPNWSDNSYPSTNFIDTCYYSAPKKKPSLSSLEEADTELLRYFDKLGVPLNEQNRLANVMVYAVLHSVSIATIHRKTLEKAGVIFSSISEAFIEYLDLVKKYLGRVVPSEDDYYSALNATIFSDGKDKRYENIVVNLTLDNVLSSVRIFETSRLLEQLNESGTASLLYHLILFKYPDYIDGNLKLAVIAKARNTILLSIELVNDALKGSFVVAVLLDKFFDMEFTDCVKAFDAYASSAKQIEELVIFYNWCTDVVFKFSNAKELADFFIVTFELMSPNHITYPGFPTQKVILEVECHSEFLQLESYIFMDQIFKKVMCSSRATVVLLDTHYGSNISSWILFIMVVPFKQWDPE